MKPAPPRKGKLVRRHHYSAGEEYDEGGWVLRSDLHSRGGKYAEEASGGEVLEARDRSNRFSRCPRMPEEIDWNRGG